MGEGGKSQSEVRKGRNARLGVSASRPEQKFRHTERSLISRFALIGDPPESRAHVGPGIPPSIHPLARIEAFVSIDAGTERPTMFGHSWALKHAHIGHDAVIGDGCEIACGAVIGGFAEIGDNVRIGLNATIRPRVKIGDGARVGMGAVVTRDVPAGMVVVGNPARDINQDPRLDPLWASWYESRDKPR